jgi:VanZ family protein
VLIAGTVLGAITEIVQASLPWPRSADAWDVAADALGLVVALGIGAALGAVATRIRRGGSAPRGAFGGPPTLGP